MALRRRRSVRSQTPASDGYSDFDHRALELLAAEPHGVEAVHALLRHAEETVAFRNNRTIGAIGTSQGGDVLASAYSAPRSSSNANDWGIVAMKAVRQAWLITKGDPPRGDAKRLAEYNQAFNNHLETVQTAAEHAVAAGERTAIEREFPLGSVDKVRFDSIAKEGLNRPSTGRPGLGSF
jgi:hypothetical protein